MKVENLKIDNQTKKGDCCPECNGNWDGGDIYERYLKAKYDTTDEIHGYYKDKTLEELKETAASYGWTEENPTRFGNVIGIDMSMDLNATKEEQYDGISYWQCPKCQIAWNRWNGTRTDKFVKSAEASVIKKLNELKEEPSLIDIISADKKPSEKLSDISDHLSGTREEKEEEEKKIIYNAIQTPDGTVISSAHQHDYVTHEDKNGKTYGVDGGTAYLRRIGDTSDCKDLSMYLEPWTPEFHEKARKVVKRGGRGVNGDEPLTWVPVCEMNDNWVSATITYNTDRGMGLKKSWFTRLLAHEIKYRKTNNITIDE